MRWQGRRTSGNVEDRRGLSPRRGAAMGGMGFLVLVVVSLLFGVDPRALLEQVGTGTSSVDVAPGLPGAAPGVDDAGKEFVSVVLADTEEVWRAIFADMGRTYEEPRLVLFDGEVRSACGLADAAVGPFYCPGDAQVYLDLGFFRQLERDLGAPGDFAQAYVIAHEVGHHVQNLLGIMDEVHRARGRVGESEYNRLSVRLELQADFLAGVWAHHAERAWDILEAGDVEEALGAASAVGDDRLQRRAQGRVVPDSFTHGTSAQRVEWFRRGLETGDVSRGDTFSDPGL
jgi:hypothetical protein